jgi:hypothetical protein
LVQVDVVHDGQPRSFSYPHLRALIERQDVLEGVFGTFDFVAESVRVPDSGTQLGVNCRLVTGSYFESLGMNAASGRAIGTRDDDPAAPSVAVVSDGFWKRILAGGSDAVGTAIQLFARFRQRLHFREQLIDLDNEQRGAVGQWRSSRRASKELPPLASSSTNV